MSTPETASAVSFSLVSTTSDAKFAHAPQETIPRAGGDNDVHAVERMRFPARKMMEHLVARQFDALWRFWLATRLRLKYQPAARLTGMAGDANTVF